MDVIEQAKMSFPVTAARSSLDGLIEKLEAESLSAAAVWGEAVAAVLSLVPGLGWAAIATLATMLAIRYGPEAADALHRAAKGDESITEEEARQILKVWEEEKDEIAKGLSEGMPSIGVNVPYSRPLSLAKKDTGETMSFGKAKNQLRNALNENMPPGEKCAFLEWLRSTNQNRPPNEVMAWPGGSVRVDVALNVIEDIAISLRCWDKNPAGTLKDGPRFIVRGS